MTPTSTSTCRMTIQSNEAKLLRHATVLMWDEATMARRYSLEAFDRTMKDITKSDEPFGGKLLTMGGDFRQVLPVIPRSTRGQTVDAYISRSPLWENVHVLHLKKNMRVAGDASYSELLIRAGDGDEPCVGDEMIKVSEEMVIPWVSDDSMSRLIEVTFPNLMENARDQNYIVNWALITPLNEYVTRLIPLTMILTFFTNKNT
ncbi:hypothetical protein MKX01_000235 [Papaver californicum]|nr:hypothetical protein MKX01_000235 [Papaver californicum]